MDIWRQPVEAVLLGLKSNRQGLSTAEAVRRLGQFGRNRIEPVQQQSLGRRFAEEFTHSLRSSCGSQQPWPSSRTDTIRAKAWGNWVTPSSG